MRCNVTRYLLLYEISLYFRHQRLHTWKNESNLSYTLLLSILHKMFLHLMSSHQWFSSLVVKLCIQYETTKFRISIDIFCGKELPWFAADSLKIIFMRGTPPPKNAIHCFSTNQLLAVDYTILNDLGNAILGKVTSNFTWKTNSHYITTQSIVITIFWYTYEYAFILCNIFHATWACKYMHIYDSYTHV